MFCICPFVAVAANNLNILKHKLIVLSVKIIYIFTSKG